MANVVTIKRQIKTTGARARACTHAYRLRALIISAVAAARTNVRLDERGVLHPKQKAPKSLCCQQARELVTIKTHVHICLHNSPCTLQHSLSTFRSHSTNSKRCAILHSSFLRFTSCSQLLCHPRAATSQKFHTAWLTVILNVFKCNYFCCVCKKMLASQLTLKKNTFRKPSSKLKFFQLESK